MPCGNHVARPDGAKPIYVPYTTSRSLLEILDKLLSTHVRNLNHWHPRPSSATRVKLHSVSLRVWSRAISLLELAMTASHLALPGLLLFPPPSETH